MKSLFCVVYKRKTDPGGCGVETIRPRHNPLEEFFLSDDVLKRVPPLVLEIGFSNLFPHSEAAHEGRITDSMSFRHSFLPPLFGEDFLLFRDRVVTGLTYIRQKAVLRSGCCVESL